MAPISNKLIAQFTTKVVRPSLGPDYFLFRKRDLARMSGPFVQLLALSVNRSGALRVHPCFYVAGADLSLEVIPQNVSLEVLDPHSWTYLQPTLDEAFAQRLLQQLEAESPLSFVAPLAGDASVSRVFRHFAARTTHWSCSLYQAFYLLACGRPSAAHELAQTRARFNKLGENVVGQAPPWRLALGERLDELERRLTLPEGQDLCRTEAQQQAQRLELPEIRWE